MRTTLFLTALLLALCAWAQAPEQKQPTIPESCSTTPLLQDKAGKTVFLSDEQMKARATNRSDRVRRMVDIQLLVDGRLSLLKDGEGFPNRARGRGTPNVTYFMANNKTPVMLSEARPGFGRAKSKHLCILMHSHNVARFVII
jgi:hypothetical protein